MKFRHLVFLFVLAVGLRAAPAGGTVSGTVVDASAKPVEYVAIAVKTAAAGQPVASATTDAKGVFSLEKLPPGEYRLSYGVVGGDADVTAPFTIDAAHPAIDLGKLALGSGVVRMERFEVKTSQAALLNSIDRKTYNVGKDIQSTSGSASDLLQNIPSVQVSVEGNVSLRGNESVLILINGKSSAMMSAANRADVLEQMQADSIERIEVITNPSAKYKPDGTAGIINLVMKRKHDAGFSGIARASVGNDSRYNFSLTGNYRPGRFNLFGTVSVRQDDRLRYADDVRQHRDTTVLPFLGTEQHTVEHMRPLSRLVQTGVDYNLTEDDKLSATVDYNYRTFFRNSTVSNRSRDAVGTLTSDYDRLRTDPEWQKTLSATTSWQHSFPGEGHELNVELKRERHWEQEDNHYTNVYRTPATTPTTRDVTLIKPLELTTELSADYTRPLAHDGKLEAGYSGTFDKNDMDFRGAAFDPLINAFVTDTTRTNRFIYQDWIHAFYGTAGWQLGQFGVLAGLRAEETVIHTNQVTARLADRNEYFRVYPTLHLSYSLSETGQLQLNYSHRIHRPESDDLNPFPEYQDPYNLRAGNPHLRPEDTHSIETGYQYRKDDTTYLAALFMRETYHGFTTVTRYIDSTTLLTTHENLATNRSGGIELSATTDIGKTSVNFSANAYRNQIDATNLGFGSSRSTIGWDAKLNLVYHASKTTQVQLATNYTAARLTPQGERRPTYVANLGLRHDLADKKTSVVFTVSDLFDSLKERTVINTPLLHDDVTRRRSARIVYLGLIYNFGKSGKKSKDDGMKFDNSL